MRRTIIERPNVSAEALTDLKSWLGISRPNEDDLLMGLILASLEMCEAFIGQAPMSQLVEERLPTEAGRFAVEARPVNSFVAADTVNENGVSSALEADCFEFEVQVSGEAHFSLNKSVEGQAISLKVWCGIAPDWDAIPAGIKQGLIRLAAYHYRDRDRLGGAGKDVAPPSSVTALWRPWRSYRLK